MTGPDDVGPDDENRVGLVSVIIPVFNGEDRVADAIDSALAQGPIVREIIVVDDGSTDSTSATVERYPEVVLRRQANAGPAAARNLAIGLATGTSSRPSIMTTCSPPAGSS